VSEASDGLLPIPAELRRHSTWLLAHAKELREEAETVRLRAVRIRLDSNQCPRGENHPTNPPSGKTA